MRRSSWSLTLCILVLSFLVVTNSRTNGQWKPLNGSSQREITTLLAIPPWFAVADGHLYIGGSSWSRVLSAPDDIVAMAVSTTNGGSTNVFFAATFQQGIYLSSDNGATWVAVNNGLPSPEHFRCLAVAPRDHQSNTILVGTESSGIYRSTDNGAHWVAANTGQEKYVFNIAAKDAATIFASANDGMLVSVDSGITWSEQNTGIEYTIYDGLVKSHPMHAVAVRGSNIFASTETAVAGPGQGIYRSTDDGTSWMKINNGLQDSAVTSFAFLGSTVFAGTFHGVFKSTDNGNTWLHTNRNVDTLIDGMGAYQGSLYMATAAGYYYSSDTARTWIEADDGLLTPGLIGNGSAIFANDSLLIVGTGDKTGYWLGGNGAFLSRDGGVHFTQIPELGNNTFVSGFAQAGRTVIAGTSQGTYRSTDNGTTWLKSDDSARGLDTATVIGLGWIGSRLYRSELTRIGTQHINTAFNAYTEDTGKSWNNDQYVFPDYEGTASCFAFDTAYGYAAGGTAGVLRRKALHDSDWKWAYDSSIGNVSALLTTPTKIYAALGAGFNKHLVCYSSDHGSTWIPMDSGITPYVTVFKDTLGASVVTLVQSGDHLLAGGMGGVFLWNDSTKKWKNVGDYGGGHTLYDVQSLAFDGSNLFAGTRNLGTWRRSLADILAEKEAVEETRPTTPISVISYPNPASSVASIWIHLNDRVRITVSLLDALGVERLRVFEGEAEAGDHSYSINTDQLPNGVYRCSVGGGGSLSQVGIVVSH